MIDIETLGVVSGSVIVSVGAVKFDIERGEYGPYFYQIVDIDSCLKRGLKVSGSTIKWWLKNSEEARNEVAQQGNDLKEVLKDLSLFIEKDDIVWSNGVRFDIALLEDAYAACELDVPWNFRNERDVRTLVSFAPGVKDRCIKENNGIEHNALEDCKLQIKYCTEIYNKIKLS